MLFTDGWSKDYITTKVIVQWRPLELRMGCDWYMIRWSFQFRNADANRTQIAIHVIFYTRTFAHVLWWYARALMVESIWQKYYAPDSCFVVFCCGLVQIIVAASLGVTRRSWLDISTQLQISYWIHCKWSSYHYRCHSLPISGIPPTWSEGWLIRYDTNRGSQINDLWV